ncbi:MAG TPA: SDR family oxidoreductase [Ramlibacter sp.]|nr:SDR family oxidoreductase [Ramlibacter sp.]
MKVLITGNMGYVGPVLTRHLRKRHPALQIVGFDAGYFAHALTGEDRLPESRLDAQHFGDMRSFPQQLLTGVDAVVHLAAISNDPMGKQFEAVTDEINHHASVGLATMARDAGVRNFVFASSCSVYGAAGTHARKEHDPLNPLTAYARSKVEVEQSLGRLDLGDMRATCLRFATACGMSDRLRLDLVLNDFVASALATGAITVLSDGTPWRPLIDVRDMARAIDWAIHRGEQAGGRFLCVNAGSDAWNYCVRDLAEAVSQRIPGTTMSINRDAAPDPRSYRVDFSQFRILAPDHQPLVGLVESIDRLREGIAAMGGVGEDFRQSRYMRLRMLQSHIGAGRLTPELAWTQQD